MFDIYHNDEDKIREIVNKQLKKGLFIFIKYCIGILFLYLVPSLNEYIHNLFSSRYIFAAVLFFILMLIIFILGLLLTIINLVKIMKFLLIKNEE